MTTTTEPYPPTNEQADLQNTAFVLGNVPENFPIVPTSADIDEATETLALAPRNADGHIMDEDGLRVDTELVKEVENLALTTAIGNHKKGSKPLRLNQKFKQGTRSQQEMDALTGRSDNSIGDDKKAAFQRRLLIEELMDRGIHPTEALINKYLGVDAPEQQTSQNETDREAYENLLRSGEYQEVFRKGWGKDAQLVSEREIERRIKGLMKEYDRDFPLPRSERTTGGATKKIVKAAGSLATKAVKHLNQQAKSTLSDTIFGTRAEIRAAAQAAKYMAEKTPRVARRVARLGGIALKSTVSFASDASGVAANKYANVRISYENRQETAKQRVDTAYDAAWRAAVEGRQRKLEEAELTKQVAGDETDNIKAA